MHLLSDNNPKTLKSQNHGYYTTILHLAPHKVSGFQTCPKAKGCEKTCLNYSGLAGMYNSVQKARISKTRLFFTDRNWFMHLLVSDIWIAQRKADKLNLKLAIRLNGTSDIAWEKIRTANSRNILEVFPHIQFYDYTKIPNRRTPPNYHLTFSQDEHNELDCLSQLQNGGNVATIYRYTMPEEHLGYPVINGDLHDLRFLDPNPRVVGLKFKRVRIPLNLAV